MEDVLGHYANVRQIFERWMEWGPDEQAWHSFIKFELRNGELERARAVFARFVQCHPTVGAWLRFAKFEEKHAGDLTRAREVFEEALRHLAELAHEPAFFIAFAQFEERTKEVGPSSN